MSLIELTTQIILSDLRDGNFTLVYGQTLNVIRRQSDAVTLRLVQLNDHITRYGARLATTKREKESQLGNLKILQMNISQRVLLRYLLYFFMNPPNKLYSNKHHIFMQ